MTSVAKSGRPVFGQMQVNSGTLTSNVVALPAYWNSQVSIAGIFMPGIWDWRPS
jgi:hypothetical protein